MVVFLKKLSAQPLSLWSHTVLFLFPLHWTHMLWSNFGIIFLNPLILGNWLLPLSFVHFSVSCPAPCTKALCMHSTVCHKSYIVHTSSRHQYSIIIPWNITVLFRLGLLQRFFDLIYCDRLISLLKNTLIPRLALNTTHFFFLSLKKKHPKYCF